MKRGGVGRRGMMMTKSAFITLFSQYFGFIMHVYSEHALTRI